LRQVKDVAKLALDHTIAVLLLRFCVLEIKPQVKNAFLSIYLFLNKKKKKRERKKERNRPLTRSSWSLSLANLSLSAAVKFSRVGERDGLRGMMSSRLRASIGVL
jgi:hypothetical protein